MQDDAHLRCTHVVASVADPGAGPTYSVTALCRNLAAAGTDVTLRSVDGWRAPPGHEAIARRAAEPFDSVTHPQSFRSAPLLSSLCASADLRDAIRTDAMTTDVLHGHGLWLMPNVYPGAACRRAGAKARYVLSPRGMLGAAALAFSPAKKRIFWSLYQKRALETVSCFHATSEAECDDVRRAGLNAPVAVIPNGIDLPAIDAAKRRDPAAERVVLSLGRIHPKKGLDRLVRAWATIEAQHPDWRLQIVGPAELGHDVALRELAHSLGLRNVSVDGPAYGAAKDALLADASLFVLPTLNENFAMTVAEALAAQVPVISTKGAPWAGLETHRCGWWIDHGVEPMSEALRQAIELPDAERARMGARGREWMSQDYSWASVASEMLDVYRWLSGAGDRPASVKNSFS